MRPSAPFDSAIFAAARQDALAEAFQSDDDRSGNADEDRSGNDFLFKFTQHSAVLA